MCYIGVVTEAVILAFSVATDLTLAQTITINVHIIVTNVPNAVINHKCFQLCEKCARH